MQPKLFRNNIASFGTPTLSDVTKNSIAVAGDITFFKDGAWGYAYKKNSASTWTYVPQTSKSVEATITGLTASTKYDVCLYVLIAGEYQRGPVASATTKSS